MILYLDSNSIVKLYIDEQRSEVVRAMRDAPENTLASSRVAYAEVRSALARRRRENHFAEESDYRRAVQDLDRDWRRSILKIPLSELIVRLAGDLTEKHGLRGFDAIHLASAVELHKRLGGLGSFSSWDNALSRAAAAEGLSLAHEGASP